MSFNLPPPLDNPLDSISLTSNIKEKYQSRKKDTSENIQKKQDFWFTSFCTQGCPYGPSYWPIDLGKLKEKWRGIEDDLERRIPIIIAGIYQTSTLHDVFQTTQKEQERIFDLLRTTSVNMTEQEKEAFITEAIAENSRWEKVKTKAQLSLIVSDWDREYHSLVDEQKHPDIQKRQDFWNIRFLYKAEDGNLPTSYADFTYTRSVVETEFEQYIPGILDFLNTNGYKKRLEDVFILTPKEREYLTNMFTCGYQMQDTQVGILERVRKLLPFKKKAP